ncbi:unnamed protein product [Prorocentrum cordatum]|uniref:Uncharacterized protein n=1 Tax=Prorocentrum cordatum TaxID=2364126 RepID=A0ABN9UFJ3_9DINO|nr:unnamed protein product [Polarella glacialis]
MGIGSAKRISTRALPIMELEGGTTATTHPAAANRWLRHSAAEEVGAVVPLEEADTFAQTIPQLQNSLTHDIGTSDAFLPTLADYQRARRSAKPSAASLDGTPGALLRQFAPDFSKMFYPVVVKACLRIEEPLQWRGGNDWNIWKMRANPSKSLQELATTLHRSAMFFMLHAISAFYRAARELVMQVGTKDVDLHLILSAAGPQAGAIEDGLYPCAMLAAATFSAAEARTLLQQAAHELSPDTSPADQALFDDPPEESIQDQPLYADRHCKYRLLGLRMGCLARRREATRAAAHKRGQVRRASRGQVRRIAYVDGLTRGDEKGPGLEVKLDVYCHRVTPELWFQQPGVRVNCDRCDRWWPQSGGMMAGAPGGSQFAQSQFLCNECAAISEQ